MGAERRVYVPFWASTTSSCPASPHRPQSPWLQSLATCESEVMGSRVALAAAAFVLAAGPCWQAPPLGQEASPAPWSSGMAQTSTAETAPPPNDDLVFGDMTVPRWLAETVGGAAQATNVDPAYLMALADKES